MTTDTQIKSALRFYSPLSKDAEADIWAKQKKISKPKAPEIPAEDELVEDAGLLDEVRSVVEQQEVH